MTHPHPQPHPECVHANIKSMRLNPGEPKQDVVFCGYNDYTCVWVQKNLGCPKERAP